MFTIPNSRKFKIRKASCWIRYETRCYEVLNTKQACYRSCLWIAAWQMWNAVLCFAICYSY